MSMMEPFMPHSATDEKIAAADPGAGAPEPAPGFGIGGEEPDRAEQSTEDQPADDDEQAPPADDGDVPFRTPEP
jgi:hypothetical protein